MKQIEVNRRVRLHAQIRSIEDDLFFLTLSLVNMINIFSQILVAMTS